jgi:hydroxymethylglutaryl-CoA reductase (NADPH)
MKAEPDIADANIPMKTVGPALITGSEVDEDVLLPLATFETPLWPSVDRGARVSRRCGGIAVTVTDDRMTRSIAVQARSAADAQRIAGQLREQREKIAQTCEGTSRFARFLDFHTQIVGPLLYIRIEMQPGDAAGHNMVTGAADALMTWLLETFSELEYVSISGNYCTDKKPSAVNGILGRGRCAVAEATISADLCAKMLKTTPEKVTALNVKKNLLGTNLAGTVRSANAHYANMLLAFYLATGQDGANIVEGSQGFTYCEVIDGALYFSVTVPHLIVGTVGNGKDIDFVHDNLEKLGCLDASRPAGANARRLAAIAAAAVWCGELSLMAAQTNPGELMRVHRKLERSP